MIESLTFLLLAQLAGEVIVRALGLPVPGPVIGLILLALIMAWRGIPPALHETALGLLRNLSLLFVPAGVGVIRQADVLAENWLALVAGPGRLDAGDAGGDGARLPLGAEAIRAAESETSE